MAESGCGPMALKAARARGTRKRSDNTPAKRMTLHFPLTFSQVVQNILVSPFNFPYGPAYLVFDLSRVLFLDCDFKWEDFPRPFGLGQGFLRPVL